MADTGTPEQRMAPLYDAMRSIKECSREKNQELVKLADHTRELIRTVIPDLVRAYNALGITEIDFGTDMKSYATDATLPHLATIKRIASERS